MDPMLNTFFKNLLNMHYRIIEENNQKSTAVYNEGKSSDHQNIERRMANYEDDQHCTERSIVTFSQPNTEKSIVCFDKKKNVFPCSDKLLVKSGPKLFISMAWEDREKGNLLIKRLEQKGLDMRSMYKFTRNQTISMQESSAIMDSDMIVMLVTESYMKKARKSSTGCAREFATLNFKREIAERHNESCPQVVVLRDAEISDDLEKKMPSSWFTLMEYLYIEFDSKLFDEQVDDMAEKIKCEANVKDIPNLNLTEDEPDLDSLEDQQKLDSAKDKPELNSAEDKPDLDSARDESEKYLAVDKQDSAKAKPELNSFEAQLSTFYYDF